MNDWRNDPVWREYAQHVLTEMLPKLADSAVSVSIAPRNDSEGDVKYWVELGASIMLDKPILVVCDPGQELPERLRRVADAVVEADLETDKGQRELAERIAVFVAQFGE